MNQKEALQVVLDVFEASDIAYYEYIEDIGDTLEVDRDLDEVVLWFAVDMERVEEIKAMKQRYHTAWEAEHEMYRDFFEEVTENYGGFTVPGLIVLVDDDTDTYAYEKVSDFRAANPGALVVTSTSQLATV